MTIPPDEVSVARPSAMPRVGARPAVAAVAAEIAAADRVLSPALGA